MSDEEIYKLVVFYSLINKYELTRFVGILELIEENVCLTIQDNGYLVCEFEKGHKHSEQLYETIDLAIFDIFARISDSNELENTLIEEYNTIIGRKKEKRRI